MIQGSGAESWVLNHTWLPLHHLRKPSLPSAAHSTWQSCACSQSHSGTAVHSPHVQAAAVSIEPSFTAQAQAPAVGDAVQSVESQTAGTGSKLRNCHGENWPENVSKYKGKARGQKSNIKVQPYCKEKWRSAFGLPRLTQQLAGMVAC